MSAVGFNVQAVDLVRLGHSGAEVFAEAGRGVAEVGQPGGGKPGAGQLDPLAVEYEASPAQHGLGISRQAEQLPDVPGRVGLVNFDPVDG